MTPSRNRRLLAAMSGAVVLLLSATSFASAAMTGSGSLSVVPAPGSVRLQAVGEATALASSTRIFGFAEGPDWTLEQPLSVDVAAPGTYHSLPATPAPIAVDPGAPSGTLHSVLIHAQRPRGASGQVTRSGTIAFDEPIVGLIVTRTKLDATDMYFGAPSTAYPDPKSKATSTRGLEMGNGGDWFTISGNRKRLTMHLRFGASLDQVRVLFRGVPCDVWPATDPNGANSVSRPDQAGKPNGDGYVICGLGGDDQLFGSDRNDVLRGGTGGELRMVAFAGDDRIYGGPEIASQAEATGGWGDNMFAGAGDDYVDGGKGVGDNAFYPGGPEVAAVTAGVYVDLLSGFAALNAERDPHPQFGVDEIVNVTSTWGTDLDDTILGSNRRDLLYGYGGRDLIRGRAGDDSIQGDDPYNFDCANNIGQNCEGPASYPNGDDWLYGDSGNDSIFGGLGSDQITGGTGEDTAGYGANPPGTGTVDTLEGRSVTVDLVAGTAVGHGSDSLATVEDVIGTNFDDHIFGNSLDNVFTGGPGDDELWGRGADDVLIAGPGADMLYGETGNDMLSSRGVADGGDLLDAGTGGVDSCTSDEPDVDTLVDCEIFSGGAVTATALAPLPNGTRPPTVRRKSVTLVAGANDGRQPPVYVKLDLYIGRTATVKIALWSGDPEAIANTICVHFRDKGVTTRYDYAELAQQVCADTLSDWWDSTMAPVFDEAGDNDRCIRIRWSIDNELIGIAYPASPNCGP